MFEVDALPAFADNYLWLLHVDGRAAVVDPGDARVVQAALDAQGLALDGILLTHHHADHTGGVATLLARHGCPVIGPRDESIPGVSRRVAGGDIVEMLGATFEVLDVPGHTRGHIAYRCADARRVFCGDTLFGAGCGRLFEGTPTQMWTSLRRLAALPGDTRVHCAHEYTLSNLRFAQAVEPDNRAVAERARRDAKTRARNAPTVPSTIALELETNPFLRADRAQVRAQAEAIARTPEIARQLDAWGLDDASTTPEVRSFAALRAWKDGFR